MSRASGTDRDSRSSVVTTSVSPVRHLRANLEFVKTHPADIRAVIEVVSNARDPNGDLRFRPRGADPVTTPP